MNSKKARKLRKLAQQLSVGKSNVQYENQAQPYWNESKPTKVLVQNCTRGINQRLKREQK